MSLAKSARIIVETGATPTAVGSVLRLRAQALLIGNAVYTGWSQTSWSNGLGDQAVVTVPTDKAGTFNVSVSIKTNQWGLNQAVGANFTYTVVENASNQTTPPGTGGDSRCANPLTQTFVPGADRCFPNTDCEGHGGFYQGDGGGGLWKCMDDVKEGTTGTKYKATVKCPAGMAQNENAYGFEGNFYCHTTAGGRLVAGSPDVEPIMPDSCPQGGKYDGKGYCVFDNNVTPPDTNPPAGNPSGGDIDGDGVPDTDDKDIDGDGINNEDDDDIDGDGIANEDDDTPSGDAVAQISNYDTLYTRASQAQYLGDVFHADPSHTNPKAEKDEGFSLPTPLLIMAGLGVGFFLYNSRKK